MKKILLLFSIGIMLISFTACGNKKVDPPIVEEEIQITEIQWPQSEIATLLPQPKSNKGKIEWEADYGFVIYIGETSKEDYNDYVKACEDKGFTVDYNKGDDYFYADNEDGYHVNLRYENDDIMFIRIDQPDDEDTDKNDDEDKEDEEKEDITETVDGMRPEFKEAMDSYEAFFDEYCEFMKKYSESANPVGMLADYTEYMNKYTDAMGKMSEIGNETMSNEELQYYTEVMARINEKLVNVSTQ